MSILSNRDVSKEREHDILLLLGPTVGGLMELYKLCSEETEVVHTTSTGF
jgi:hypothetical protein